MLLAGRTLSLHASSRVGRENLEVFCDAWSSSVNNLSRITRDLDIACSDKLAAEKQAYMSLPRPGVSSSSHSNPKLNLYPCDALNDGGVRCCDKSFSSLLSNNRSTIDGNGRTNSKHSNNRTENFYSEANINKPAVKNGVSMDGQSSSRALSHEASTSSDDFVYVQIDSDIGVDNGVRQKTVSSITPRNTGVKFNRVVSMALDDDEQVAPLEPVIICQKEEKSPLEESSMDKKACSDDKRPGAQKEHKTSTAPLANCYELDGEISDNDDDELMKDYTESSYELISSTSLEVPAPEEDGNEKPTVLPRRKKNQTTNFEHRISVILESLQMEAESLMRLQLDEEDRWSSRSGGSGRSPNIVGRT